MAAPRAASSLIALAISLASGASHAIHPLITDDTDTQGKGKNQLEINADRAGQAGAEITFGALTYSRGATDELDLILNLPVTFSSPSGLNDALLGAKWRFAESGGASAGLRADLSLPAGDYRQGLGTGRAGLALVLMGSIQLDRWTWLGNAAVTILRYRLPSDSDANRAHTARISGAAIYAVNDQWKLAADLGVAQSTLRAQDKPNGYALLGVIHSPVKSLDLDAGVRFGLGCGSCSATLKHQVGVGLTSRF